MTLALSGRRLSMRRPLFPWKHFQERAHLCWKDASVDPSASSLSPRTSMVFTRFISRSCLSLMFPLPVVLLASSPLVPAVLPALWGWLVSFRCSLLSDCSGCRCCAVLPALPPSLFRRSYPLSCCGHLCLVISRFRVVPEACVWRCYPHCFGDPLWLCPAHVFLWGFLSGCHLVGVPWPFLSSVRPRCPFLLAVLPC